MSDRVAAVIVAAGWSMRMGFDKLWVPLAGRPVISYALRVLASCTCIETLVLVSSASAFARAKELVREVERPVAVCEGGLERRDSVAAGLAAAGAVDWIVVHDAARPFVTLDLVHRGLQAARESGAAVAAVPVRDTIKRVSDSQVLETLVRAELWQVQTPQVFRSDVLRSALANSDAAVTDEATLVERSGQPVRVYPGSETNLKITLPGDLQLAEALLTVRAYQPREASAVDSIV